MQPVASDDAVQGQEEVSLLPERARSECARSTAAVGINLPPIPMGWKREDGETTRRGEASGTHEDGSASSRRFDDLDDLRGHKHAVPPLAGPFSKDVFTNQLFNIQLSRALRHFQALRRLAYGNSRI